MKEVLLYHHTSLPMLLSALDCWDIVGESVFASSSNKSMDLVLLSADFK